MAIKKSVVLSGLMMLAVLSVSVPSTEADDSIEIQYLLNNIIKAIFNVGRKWQKLNDAVYLYKNEGESYDNVCNAQQELSAAESQLSDAIGQYYYQSLKSMAQIRNSCYSSLMNPNTMQSMMDSPQSIQPQSSSYAPPISTIY